MVVEAQAREDQAMEVWQARRIARLAAELLDVIDGEDGGLGELLVDQPDVLAREWLDGARDRLRRARLPEVGEAQQRLVLFGDQDVVGIEQTAEAVHHLADAVLGVELVHARADDVVDGELLIEDLLVCRMALQVAVEVDAHAEMAGLAVPRDERVAEQHVGIQDLAVEDVGDAARVVELIEIAVLAGSIVARHERVALLARERRVGEHAELVALGLVEVEDVVRLGVGDAHAKLNLVEELAREDEVIVAVERHAVELLFRTVQALDQELQQAVDAADL